MNITKIHSVISLPTMVKTKRTKNKSPSVKSPSAKSSSPWKPQEVEIPTTAFRIHAFGTTPKPNMRIPYFITGGKKKKSEDGKKKTTSKTKVPDNSALRQP